MNRQKYKLLEVYEINGNGMETAIFVTEDGEIEQYYYLNRGGPVDLGIDL